jgi:hypothetical protein
MIGGKPVLNEARSVRCPYCKAPVGERCWFINRKTKVSYSSRKTHPSRGKLAKAINAEREANGLPRLYAEG